jgi:probable rRNA maturation factor
LRRFWRELAARIAGGGAAVCLVSTDPELRALNRRFRGRDYAPDVLSFRPSPGDGPGEIAISFDRAAAQAAQYGHSLEDELRILMLHGMLHLGGMNHETDSGEMARAEARWRRTLKLPLALIERAGRGGGLDGMGRRGRPDPSCGFSRARPR